jgi:hypothetical protein
MSGTHCSARALLGAGVAVALAAGAPAADQPPLAVSIAAAMVEERKEVDDATKNALKKKKDEASKAKKALEKQLKEQLGKKRESWPPEKDEELYRLEEAEAVAEADYEYRKIDTKAIGDAVEDLQRAAQGKGMQAGKKDRINVVGSLAEADLAVSVLARRSQKQLGAVVPSDCWVLFSIGAGGKLPAERFAKIPVSYRARKFGLSAWKIASPSGERPVFVFEGWNGGGSSIGCHGAAANSASGLIDKFIEDNYAALTGK